jgi:hypothetical protein
MLVFDDWRIFKNHPFEWGVYGVMVAVSIIGLFPILPKIATRILLPTLVEKERRGVKSRWLIIVHSIRAVAAMTAREFGLWILPGIYMIGGFATFIAVGYLVWNFLGERLVLIILLCGVGTVLLSLAIWLIPKGIRAYGNDRAVLHGVRVRSVMQRQTIEETLNSLRTNRAKMKFIGALLSNHVVAVGSWHNGQLPFKSDDRVSDELLRLEERWLKLDR